MQCGAMNAQQIRIDPALPVCWEDLDTLRVGFESPAVRITKPSAGEQRFIGALRQGLNVPLGQQHFRRFGITRAQWQRVLECLAPTLVVTNDSVPPPPRIPSDERVPFARSGPALRGAEAPIWVVGDGATPRLIAHALQSHGYTAHARSDGAALPGDADIGALICVERFLEPFNRHRLTLAELGPQISFRCTDRAIWLGPFTHGRDSPCPGCAVEYELDSDPTLPVLAAQLIGKTPASETPTAIAAATSLAVTALLRSRMGDQTLRRARLRIPVSQGVPALLPELHELRPHPRCRCAGPGAASTQPPMAIPASEMNREG